MIRMNLKRNNMIITTYFRSKFSIVGSVGKLVGTRTKSSEFVFSGLLDSLCVLFSAIVILESSVATICAKKTDRISISHRFLSNLSDKFQLLFYATFYPMFSFEWGLEFSEV